MRVLKAMAYGIGCLWCSPNTIVGLLVALFGGSTYLRRDPTWGCLIYVAREGGLLYKWMAGGGVGGLVGGQIGAVTLGQVILFARVEWVNEGMLRHENRHTWQGLLLGILDGPIYAVGCLVAWAQGKHPYRDCFLEVDARRAAGES